MAKVNGFVQWVITTVVFLTMTYVKPSFMQDYFGCVLSRKREDVSAYKSIMV